MNSQLEKFLQRRGGILFATYVLFGGAALSVYRTLDDANFAFAFKYLSAPILLLSFYVYLFKMPGWRAKQGPVKGPLFTLCFSLLLIATSAGYVSIVNAFGPGQRNVIIQGKISELSTTHSRRTSYWVTVVDKSGKSKEFRVTRGEYDTLAVGEQYSARWKLGSLGMIYK